MANFLTAECTLSGGVPLGIENTRPLGYPANDLARSGSVLSAQFTNSARDQGSIDKTKPDGEVLKGECSAVRGGAVQLGSILGSQ